MTMNEEKEIKEVKPASKKPKQKPFALRSQGFGITELEYYKPLANKIVTVNFLDGTKLTAELVGVDVYSLILQTKSITILVPKHAIKHVLASSIDRNSLSNEEGQDR
jgi:sRNA-binding regulator protein Hfq